MRLNRSTELKTMALLRIHEVEPLQGFKLKLTLTDGSIIEREVSRLFVGPVFENIRKDPALFAQVRVEGWNGSMAERRRSLPGCSHLGRPAAGRRASSSSARLSEGAKAGASTRF